VAADLIASAKRRKTRRKNALLIFWKEDQSYYQVNIAKGLDNYEESMG
jgi:hypothetical protein